MIHIDTSKAITKLKKEYKHLSKKETDKAIRFAFNQATRKTRVYMSKEVRKAYTIRAKDFNKGISVRKLYSTSKNQYTEIKISGKKHSLDKFSTRQTKAGLSVALRKGSRKKIRSAFMATVNGTKKAFARGNYGSTGFKYRKKRVSKKGNDLPITNLSGMSNVNMVLSKDNRLLDMSGVKLKNEAVDGLKTFFNKASKGYI